VSILYCAIPHFAAALARREDPDLGGRPLVLIDPEGRVFGVSTEAAACGVIVGLTARAAEILCPEGRLLDADVARCRGEFDTLLELLERFSADVEPHSWGAAYVNLGDTTRRQADVVDRCQQVGRSVRGELGRALQPALGWDSTKFTAQAAARRTRPGHLLVVAASKERGFLHPLSVAMLPLPGDALRRLIFLGLRTMGQYALLPPGAVRLRFGQAGRLAQRCARGEDDRPIIPRRQTPRRLVRCEFDTPLIQRDRMLFALQRGLSPILAELREGLKACGKVRLTVDFDDREPLERERALLFPTADEDQLMRALGHLLDRAASAGGGQMGVAALAVALEQIQDTVVEQLTLFSAGDERARKLRSVQRYLLARFGADRLRRTVLAQPGSPLPEWRAGWLEGEEA
jgi:nucleotidyltransferase/DNA polymerase involved in DNA repair